MAEQNDGNYHPPDDDAEFFAALGAVFRQFPDAANKYVISSRFEPTDSSYGAPIRPNGLGRIGDTLVMQSFDEDPPLGASHCFSWGIDPETGSRVCEIWWLNP